MCDDDDAHDDGTKDATKTQRRCTTIYTKTGDEGASCLYNMERRDKDDGTFAALGDVDECNVACGMRGSFVWMRGMGLRVR